MKGIRKSIIEKVKEFRISKPIPLLINMMNKQNQKKTPRVQIQVENDFL